MAVLRETSSVSQITSDGNQIDARILASIQALLDQNKEIKEKYVFSRTANPFMKNSFVFGIKSPSLITSQTPKSPFVNQNSNFGFSFNSNLEKTPLKI